MLKETFYFQHDFEPTSDPKIQALIGTYGAAGYGVFWRITEMLHSNTDHKLPHKEYIIQAIAKQMLTSVEQISAMLNDCINVYELFASDGSFFWSERVNRNIEKRVKISELRSAAGKAGANAKQNQANKRKVKEKKVKEKKEKKINTPNDIPFEEPPAAENHQPQDHPLIQWIKKELLQVAKMKEQLTNEQAENLVTKFNKKLLKEKLEEMNNTSALLKKYISVNLTVQSWIRLEKKRNPEVNTKPKNEDHSERYSWGDLRTA